MEQLLHSEKSGRFGVAPLEQGGFAERAGYV